MRRPGPASPRSAARKSGRVGRRLTVSASGSGRSRRASKAARTIRWAPAASTYSGDKDTLFRIHGTNQPEYIGQAISSGCIRMTNEDVIDLYNKVRMGSI